MRSSLSRSSSVSPVELDSGSPFSLGRRTSSSSWSSVGAYHLLEPIEGTLPHEIVEVSLKSSSRRVAHSHSKPACSLRIESTFSPFSFPRNHTTHVRCSRHGIGIVHDPALALPARDSRCHSSKSNVRSSSSSCSSGSSTDSKRSLKCTLKRVMTVKRP